MGGLWADAPAPSSDPRCDTEPRRHVLRGFVGRNGYGAWCFFPHAFAEGIPLEGEALRAVEAGEAVEWTLPHDELPRP